ncbi:MAG TPA: transferrin receptor-like dimerization domain-containing protein [Candidatus Acidoferrum sp.]|nr:transferrin receptor-like dimerization domain-containing protein [Methylomirabilota bacterium]HUK30048.1 transferrin receptor-like dimerization domain-containing protein [Candidatus Acidoferrum sp.]
MHRRIALVSILLGGISLAPMGSHVIADDQPLYGYSAESSRAERQWEEKLRAIPSPENLRAYMQRLSAHPHHVGSPYDKDNAEWLLTKYKEFGLDAHIEQFDVLFPTPKERVVELVEGGPKFVAKLQEPALPQDPTSGQKDEQLPTYNAYSIDGDVTAPLVYVNYGVPEDYEQLERMGVSVKGKIVIARYYHSWRGIKPKVAAEHGAVGCLIYSDPHEDGFVEGETFPGGPYRPPDGVQRGSVADMPYYPGDPLTPGVGATKDAKRLKIEEAATITKIPVLPISYGDAQPLLAALTGRVAPENWRGGLGITYHVGPGPAKVHLKVKSNWDIKPVYDVIAKIPGATFPDEWVIRGNHHDGWVNGAEDPTSGQVAILEEARALGELVKAGWKPKRTIIYCSWDGEEPGLLGSTEWAERHYDELRAHAVAYINSDANGRGYFFVEGSHTLEKLSNDVARDVTDPETKLSVWKRDQLREIANAHSVEQREEVRRRADLRIPALGSGSDYTAFLQHDGVASLNFGFGGEDGGGIYHSIYDDFYWYTHFSDTDFVYGRALAQTGGTAVLRLADADLLPFDFGDFADTVQKYLKELKELAQKSLEEIRERNREIEEGVFKATNDPRRPLVSPAVETVPPHLNFAPFENAADTLNRSAAEYRKAYEQASANGGAALASASLAEVNKLLMESERKLTNTEGLPNRPWFKHQLYAPGFYTGYAVKTVPAVREAIELKQWKQADEAIVLVSHVLEDEAALISSAAAKLSAAASH